MTKQMSELEIASEKTDSTTVHIRPSLVKAMKKRGLDQDMNFSRVMEAAIRAYLSPPRVIFWKDCTPDEQVMLDSLLDMMRNPRFPSESKAVEWLRSIMADRITS
jgi:hypothetical protein